MVLERSWELLEALEAVLGGVDASGGAAPYFPGGLGSIFSSVLAPEKGPRRRPKRRKIDPKIVLKNDRVLDRS